MNPIQATVKGVPATICCHHWREWPPGLAALDETPEALRASGKIDEATYARLNVWGRVCGLHAMQEAKCLACPLVRRVERRALGVFIETLDGKTSWPTFDLMPGA